MTNIFRTAIAMNVQGDGGVFFRLDPWLIAPGPEHVPALGILISHLIDELAACYADENPDVPQEIVRLDIIKWLDATNAEKDRDPNRSSDRPACRRDHLRLVK